MRVASGLTALAATYVAIMGSAYAADPVLREAKSVAVGATAGAQAPIKLPLGRFIALSTDAANGPVTYDVSDPLGVAQITLPAGAPFGGVKYDEPADAVPGIYQFADVKGEVCILVGRRPGTIKIATWVNGKDKGPSKLSELVVEVGGGVTPLPEPGPNPQPAPGPADAKLVAKFKDALAVDTKVGNGSKQHAGALGEVYSSAAGLLELNDPAVAPRTVGDLYQKTFAASVAKGIPRRPYMNSLRTAVDDFYGKYDGETPLTDALRTELVSKYRALGAALTEVSK